MTQSLPSLKRTLHPCLDFDGSTCYVCVYPRYYRDDVDGKVYAWTIIARTGGEGTFYPLPVFTEWWEGPKC